MRPRPRDPPSPLERRQIERRRRAGRLDARARGSLFDRLAHALDLAAPGGLEEVDLGQPAELVGEPSELVTETWAPALEQLAIAVGEGGIVLVAHVLEEADDLRLLHVLDSIYPEQGGVATVTLDLLG